MVNKPTPEWLPAMPAPTAAQSMPIAPIPMPKWFHSPSSPPMDNKTWLTTLIKIICAIKEIPPQRLTLPEFTFELISKAAKKNYLRLMRKYKGSLVALLEVQHNLTVGYSSELWDVDTLARIFG
jgi:hypothetical protein